MSYNTTITVQQAITELDDKRVRTIRPLIPPQILCEELPLDLRGAQTVLVRLLPFLI
jgi:3-deoxy-7-phosphoheptulonate synthase